MTKKTFKYWLWMLLLGAAILSSRNASAEVSLVSTGAVWKYLDNGTDQGIAWFGAGFDDSSWASGPAELGFGDGGEATTNTAGFITYYYRRNFSVPDASSITNLRARLKRDDGAVVYLNGAELYRDNMPAGSVTYLTLAATTASDDGSVFYSTNLNPGVLLTGNNVLAVEVHQSATTSSDISFDFELLANPSPVITLTSPANAQTLPNTNFVIAGIAVPAGQTVSLVEAFTGSTKLGQSTSAAFSIPASLPPGSYPIYAKVTDSSGLVAFSSTNNVTLQAGSFLISRGSTWKFNNTGTDLGSDWSNPNYDDSAWGGPLPGPLGDNLDGGIQAAASVINIGPSGSRFPVVYYRKSFTVANAAAFQGLTMRVRVDDFAVVFINGTKVLNNGVPEPLTYAFTGGAAAADDGVNYAEFTIPASVLVNGTNVVAVANYQQAATSSDLIFDLELEGASDTNPPTVGLVDPVPGSTALDITFINIVFNEAVVGVTAGDLLINSEPATSVVTNFLNDYTFRFSRPPTGLVHVAWAANPGITDASPLANAFAPTAPWTYVLDPNAAQARFSINEFMADNGNGIKDDDGNRSDWIELANTGTIAGNLVGYFLTDDPTNLTKWIFPLVSINANNYLLVWASAKDRTNSGSPLHTNFKLPKAGGYLALVDPKTNIISQFAPYPAQNTDVSYGRVVGDPNSVGYFVTPTPRAQNSLSGPGFMPSPVFSYDTGIYTNATISLVITADSGTIRYTASGDLPTTNSPIYTGPLVIGTNATIKARVFPPAGSTLFPSDVIARNYIFLDNTTADFASNLPLMIISTEGRPIVGEIPPGGSRTNGSFTIIDVRNAKSSLRSTPDFQVLAGFEYFGQTSIGFAKKPFRVETHDALGNDLKVSILGMPADSDYKIRNPYDDKTMLNDYLAAEYFEKMGHYSTRRRFVEAFVDTGGGRLNYASDYYGILVIMENIKIGNGRVDIPQIPNTATNEPIISGGYIFKKDKDSTGDLNFGSAGGSGFGSIPLKFHEPKPNDLRVTPISGALTAAGNAQLNYLKNFVNRMEAAMYNTNWTTLTGTNHYSYYMDVDSFVDFHWLIEFTKQIDGYRISNYFHKDRNGKIAEGPVWDFNLAFGNANYLLGGQTNGWYYDQLGDVDHAWLRRLITGTASGTSSSGDPEFTQKIADRWAVLRTNFFNGDKVLARIDELATYLNDAANRDLTKYNSFGTYYWPNPDGGVATAGSIGSPDGRDVDYVRPRFYNDGTTNSIIGQMKKYMMGRYLWIDSQFARGPVFDATDSMVTNGFVLNISGLPGVPIYYTTDGTDPRGFLGTTNGTLYTGPITVNGNMKIVARSRGTNAWKGVWSAPASVALYSSIPPLRITEIMYHPAPPPVGSTNSASDFEYVEVKNIGSTPLNVNRFSIGGDISFLFPNVVLSAGQSGVVVKDLGAFQSRYGTNNPAILILGVFAGQLNNAGGKLTLLGAAGEPILNFNYADTWYPATDGAGYSLVAANENGPISSWNTAAGWRPSSASGGSPGATDPLPPARPPVLVNEVMTHTQSPSADTIELYNPTAGTVNLGGWFLSDKFGTPKKYVIPANTTIPPFGYIVFYETNTFNFPTNGLNSFALGADGDDVWLFSGDGVNLTGYAHGYNFGAAPLNSTFGRYVISTGEEQFVLQQYATLGATNSGPFVGPIVITEINAHPSDIGYNNQPYNNTMDEYIELRNIAATSTELYHPGFPTNTWRLRDAVNYTFPTNIVLPPGAYILIVSFDPSADANATAAFRARNGVPANLPLYGPWAGSLDNSSASVELVRPDAPDLTNVVNYFLADKVKYSDQAPWTSGWDGTGLTLQRISQTSYGNDPANWATLAQSPGGQSTPSGTAPAITSQPSGRVVPTGTSISLAVTATGTAPLLYQWQRNSFNIAGATNSILTMTNFQTSQGGDYNIIVYNSAGATLGTPFTLSTRTGLQILQQPLSRITTNGGTTNFTVGVTGSGFITYQWKLNGVNVSATNAFGAETATLTITNAQSFNEGNYTVTVRDDYDTTTSAPVSLALVSKMLYTVHPLSQQVVQGQPVTLTVAASGTPPFTFRWRKQTGAFSFTNVVTNVTVSGYSYFTITNFQVGDATNYNVSGSNVLGLATLVQGGSQTGTSSNAVLTVLADTDGDGLPDVWESGRPGFSVNDPSDALRDDDGDGMSNKAEFIAGTDYLNSQSYLKVNTPSNSPATLGFLAVSNRTYSILYSDALGSGITQKLADVLAFRTNRVLTITDPNPGSKRFYRLVTPIQP